MLRIRFNHVLLVLMLVSGVSAFVLPPAISSGVRGRIDGVFAPVAYPLRKVAATVSGQLQARADSAPADASAAPPALREEIAHLRAQVASLTVQLEQLQRIHADRQLLGDAQKYCSPFAVIGGDREMLSISGTTSDGLAAGMAVVHKDSVVGKVAVAGAGGAQIRLITDRGTKMGGLVGRFTTGADGKVAFVKVQTPPLLVEGRGDGLLGITNLTVQQALDAQLVEGDVVYLNDPDDWPMPLNGYFVGRVTQVSKLGRAPLYADITITPKVNLKQLREVMVMTGKAPASGPPSQIEHPAAPAAQAPAPPARTGARQRVQRSRGGIG